MARVEIDKLIESDYDLLMKFLDDNWRRGHIFTYNKEIFDFQHRTTDGSYNFLVAKVDGLIVGVFGYIPATHYDEGLDSNYVWGAIWKVLPEAPIGLGLKMLKDILKLHSKYGAVGLSDDAVRMYKALGYTTGTVNQYYILNPIIENYKIAIAKTPLIARCESAQNRIEDVESVVDTGDIEGVYAPKKSVSYFVNRYENHPIYKYRFLVIENTLLIAYRIVDVDGSRCLRIVDVLGDLNAVDSLHCYLLALLEKYNAEYIDCLNFGVDEVVFQKHGFQTLDQQDDKVIIPNYFEPFEQRNIVLHCGDNTKDVYYAFFKGDADQDRPNMI